MITRDFKNKGRNEVWGSLKFLGTQGETKKKGLERKKAEAEKYSRKEGLKG